MASPTLENRFEALLEEQDGDVSFKIDTIVAEALEVVPDRSGSDRGLLEDVVKGVVAAMVPMITASIQKALSLSAQKGIPEKISRAIRSHDYRIDEQEQYSRRENLMIRGIPETENEVTNDKVVEVAELMRVRVAHEDISTSHRIGRPQPGRERPLVARFVRRDKRTEILRNKKKLKDTNRGVFVDEHLSPLRAKLLNLVKRDEDTARVWTIDGKIFCTRKGDPEGKKYVLTTPDDLFKQLGWGEQKLKDSGLLQDF